MNCFPCFQSQRSKKSASKRMTPSKELKELKIPAENQKAHTTQVQTGNIAAQTFTFRELATATKNFRQECLLGEGGFGRVYKGMIQGSGQVVAVKQLDRNGLQGNKEFLVEVLMLSLLHHQNLVNLVGYCADGDQRLLVYEFMPGGSVEDHLLGITPERKPLDWKTRMKIAFGAAQGLEYLHDKANPPVIYRDLKSSNILLDEDFNPKLSDFGLAKLGPVNDKMHVSSRVMGTYGYCAPEYSRSGHLTAKSDVYSFGVVLLELITGRRAIDTTKPIEEQNLVAWAQPIFRDPKQFPDMADPRLNKQFPEKSLNQAVAIAAMCLQEEPAARPLMSDVVTTLTFLTAAVYETPAPVTPPDMSEEKNKGKDKDPDSSDHEDEGSEKDEDQESSDDEDRESEKHSDDEDPDGNSSDHSYSDSSVYEDGESEDEHQQDIAESKKWSSVSSRKSSRRSQDRSVSSGHKDSSDASVSSSNKSSRGSHDRSLKQKSSKKFFSLSRKSSKGSKDGSVSLSHKSSRKSSLFSLSRKSSKESQDGNSSRSQNSSRSSRSSPKSSLRSDSSKGSHDGSRSSSHKSSKRSQNESISFGHNSSGKSQDGDVCLEHNNSRG